jgi:hypothetical protein
MPAHFESNSGKKTWGFRMRGLHHTTWEISEQALADLKTTGTAMFHHRNVANTEAGCVGQDITGCISREKFDSSPV